MFRADERESAFHDFSYLLRMHFNITSPTTQLLLSIVGMRYAKMRKEKKEGKEEGRKKKCR